MISRTYRPTAPRPHPLPMMVSSQSRRFARLVHGPPASKVCLGVLSNRGALQDPMYFPLLLYDEQRTGVLSIMTGSQFGRDNDRTNSQSCVTRTRRDQNYQWLLCHSAARGIRPIGYATPRPIHRQRHLHGGGVDDA